MDEQMHASQASEDGLRWLPAHYWINNNIYFLTINISITEIKLNKQDMSTKADYSAEDKIRKAISVKWFWKDIGIAYGENRDK